MTSAEGTEPPAHLQRETAESFGAEAERYDRARPRYPEAMIEAIVAGSPGPDVLDVGVGTGIAARQFAAAGCRVLGVDPDARMAEMARRSGTPVEVAAFEAWDPRGRTFDAVVAAQSWHWVDSAAGVDRAARVLRPRGRLALFWNAFEPPPDLYADISAVYRRVLPDSWLADRWAPGPEGYAMLADRVADDVRRGGAFAEPEQWRFAWDRRYTRDEWLDQLPTFALHTQLSASAMVDVVAGVGAAIDAVGGAFTMRFTAVVVTAVRTG